MKMRSVLAVLLCFSACVAFADESVLQGKESRKFRIYSNASTGQCLKCTKVKGAVGEYGRERVVFTWAKECSGRDSEFSYVNHGDHNGFYCGEGEELFAFLNRPGIDPLAVYKAEQLFMATPTNDAELRGSMNVDLRQNADGSYSLASYDEEGEGEGVRSPPFCLGDKNSKVPSVSGAAVVVKHGPERKECARLSLKDPAPAKAIPLPRPKPEKSNASSGK